jgi:hypothetical protein
MENKETLEEFAEKVSRAFDNDNYKALMDLVIDGDKWQQEQDENKYSEEEVLVKLYECLGHFAYQHNILINGNEIDKWFVKFKK